MFSALRSLVSRPRCLSATPRQHGIAVRCIARAPASSAPVPRKWQSSSVVRGAAATYAPQLAALVNKVTGYDAVQDRKARVEIKSDQLALATRALDDAKRQYEDAIDERRRCQKEINSLLQRKDSWIDQDISQFTTLYRKDHTLESQETSTKASYKTASTTYDALNAEYLSLIRERYIDEQLYSDKIRAASVYWTILHLCIFLLLTFVGWGIRGWDREVLLRGVERVLREERSTMPSSGPAVLDASGKVDSETQTEVSAHSQSLDLSANEEARQSRRILDAVGRTLNVHSDEAAFAVGVIVGAAVSVGSVAVALLFLRQ
ncbi:Mdm33 family-domain-containing protein [Chytriomyces sp. MP71]|nr:Mdm33 family-domain-containing protein [Chytriomyces sp. MP71]